MSVKSGIFEVPDELWGRFGPVLTIVRDYGFRDGRKFKGEYTFEYEVMPQQWRGSVFVLWIMEGSNDAMYNIESYLKREARHASSRAQKPIEVWDGVPDWMPIGTL